MTAGLAGNIPGKTDTMPISIYSHASSGDWSKANLMVIFFSLMSGLFLYIANQFSKRLF
ncbi:MAG: molybdate transporter, inner rane subunit [Deltaproteobacteria bacterium]|nr:molybdate transporter, inner rane subunit [Deltaproteobacteria bacterium]